MTAAVEVTQADRDAAALLYDRLSWQSWDSSKDPHSSAAQWMVDGKGDSSPCVQAFARHRVAHPPADQRLREAAQFLCDRLAELEWMDDDLAATVRDYFGHVDPAVDRLRTALAAPLDDGWVTVPREPTEAMVEAWASAAPYPLGFGLPDEEANRLWATADWHAMIAAAATSPILSIGEGM